ncbi:MAG: hypothetical protein HRT35_18060 [Algicola sp.]|nr:hypothetical protein [Algicola sp.]
MSQFDASAQASSLNGFGWILRPYKNSFGLFSVLLIFVAVLSVWLVSLISYQFKHRYFDQLSGIYPPIFSKASHNVDWPLIQQNVRGISGVYKEHFGRLIDVCIDDNKGVGFRPVRTGIRTLADETLADQVDKYTAVEGEGVWMSSALYEVVFGEPYMGDTGSKTLTLISRIKRRNREFVNAKTCQTNGRKVELPIIKVLPLAGDVRWLILRKSDVARLNVAKKLTTIYSVYTRAIGEKERWVYQNIQDFIANDPAKTVHHSTVKYWIDELPSALQIQLEKIVTRFYIFLMLTFVMVMSFMINLYLMTQKNLQENFYLLRYFGVSKTTFFSKSAMALTVFWFTQYFVGFWVAYGLLLLTQPELFAGFAMGNYLKSVTSQLSAFLALFTVVLPLGYMGYHFWTNDYNRNWKDTQH